MVKPSKNMPNLTGRDDVRGDWQFRALQLRSSSIDLEGRSIEATIATENPVLMPDWHRMEMVPEILRADGAVLPPNGTVPLLDSHNRNRVSDQLGSARQMAVDGTDIGARLHFSEAHQNEWTKVREGHVTDVSVGYEILQKQFVPRGETKTIKGREYSGPANVVTKWRPREVSLTPIGADSLCKLRGLDPSKCRFLSPELTKVRKMSDELKKLCVAAGMDESLSDDDAQKWLVENGQKVFAAASEGEGGSGCADGAPSASGEGRSAKANPFANFTPESISKLIADGVRQAVAEQESKRKAFATEVDSLCELAGLPDEAAKCRSMADIAAVRSHLLEARKTAVPTLGYGVSIRQTGSGFEEFRKDMGTALSMRALSTVAKSQETIDKVFPVEERGKHADRFKYATPYQMAEDYVRQLGVEVRGLTRQDVAICAMFGPQAIGQRNGNPAINVTGSFPAILLDAFNKSMMVGYTEAPSTWKGPMRQGESAADFKNINRIQLGAIPNLPVWNDNKNPEVATFADGKETYAVEARSLEVPFSYRSLVNDDMDVFSRVPAQLGNAASRTVNAVAWTPVTSNPTMRDGVALFSAATGARKRSNKTTGANTPTVANLQTCSNLMRQMRGENTPEGQEGADVLNLQPRYIIGPSALETTIKQLVLSAYDPAANTFQVYNTASQLIPVIEPLLDASSTTAWYVFADPTQIDTIEVTFLQGQETPFVRNFMDERNLSQVFIVLQTFGVKALNHRGMQMQVGA